ncbi:D-site 20S pre-rRNA nuclease [Aulographum hederae CBS 113979]|uniref:20S-pre-rRNA D-site endonuclease NOB1 n=1 Tax=Aulographum hederae CBS 113979 TaxID=1176131 RepID=A0A6G1GLX4_9PEZI|nr:D-site 20S pre-rRNA nuclease [Aulographum hederae CBS 113979]
MATEKPIHHLILDAGPMIKNEPSVSTLIAQAESLITIPAVLNEIRDEATRSRVETTLRPFLTLRSPQPSSIKVVTDFARKTGDLSVLSKPDIQIMALAYELECERNGGDWRLRSTPGQKRTNGPPPPKSLTEESKAGEAATEELSPMQSDVGKTVTLKDQLSSAETEAAATAEVPSQAAPDQSEAAENQDMPQIERVKLSQVEDELVAAKTDLNADGYQTPERFPDVPQADILSPPELSEFQEPSLSDESDSDSEGWITPSNIRRKQSQQNQDSSADTVEAQRMQVATMTTDFAMQNVLLQMNLNLLSPSMQRVRHVNTYILRCHACFEKCRNLTKQFCPRCGKPTLTRVACSTNANGEFKLHLKGKMQWNHRGERYSIPKPVNGSSSGKVNVGGGGKGGGKGGWGHGLILAPDQKEYIKAVSADKRSRRKQQDLMDEDYLPSILTGASSRKSGGRPKIGAGRNINSRKFM